MPMYDYKFLLDEAVDQCAAASTYTTAEINFGVANPNVGANQNFGAHVVITTAYTNLESGVDAWVVHGAATTPTTKLCCRRLPVASMTAGAHFYIPIPPTNLQYMRMQFVPVSETSSNGACTTWLGPPTGDEI